MSRVAMQGCDLMLCQRSRVLPTTVSMLTSNCNSSDHLCNKTRVTEQDKVVWSVQDNRWKLATYWIIDIIAWKLTSCS